jgi:sodium/potassium-transporting ATPase subunit alpha
MSILTGTVADFNASVRMSDVISYRARRSVMLNIGDINSFKSQEQSVQSKIDGQTEEVRYVEHLFSSEELARYFMTHIDPNDVKTSRGLSSNDAATRLEEYGPNELTPPETTPLWLLFLMQFLNVFMVLLTVAGLLSIVAFFINDDISNLYLGVVLLVVVVITCYQTFAQEAKSDDLMAKFRAMVPDAATAIRDGTLQSVKAAHLVVGDLVRLTSGEKVPADCVVLLSDGFKVDQSMLTGESDAVETTTKAADKNPLEARNLLFNGSLAVEGSCLAVVIRTGDRTLIGGMVGLTGDLGKSKSTLKADIELYVSFLLRISMVQAILIFAVGVARGIAPVQAFVNGFISE